MRPAFGAPSETRLAIRPKTARAKKSSAKSSATKAKKASSRKPKGKPQATAKKAGAKKKGPRRKKAAKTSPKKAAGSTPGPRKSARKSSSRRTASTTRPGRVRVRDEATRSHPATIARTYPKRIGHVSHYYAQADAALIRLDAGEIRVGDTIHIRGHTTDFFERVEELRVDDQNVDRAKSGQTVGIRLTRAARENDGVFLLSN